MIDSRAIFVTILCVLLNATEVLNAQDHLHDHAIANTHEHHHSQWEIGIALGVVPLLDEDELAPGIHLHFLHQVEAVNKLMVGFGFENVIDEHTHLTAGVVLNYNIYKGFFVAVSPGVLWVRHDEAWETAYVTHFELSYEFDLGQLHIGPIAEYSFSSLDKHVMAGIHLGFGF